jgi:hypothetical protein
MTRLSYSIYNSPGLIIHSPVLHTQTCNKLCTPTHHPALTGCPLRHSLIYSLHCLYHDMQRVLLENPYLLSRFILPRSLINTSDFLNVSTQGADSDLILSCGRNLSSFSLLTPGIISSLMSWPFVHFSPRGLYKD